MHAATVTYLTVFAVSLTAAVRAIRLGWWLRSGVAGRSGQDEADALKRLRRARLLARSTVGLTQAATWLTCSGGAMGLHAAWTLIVNTSRPMLAMIAEGSLDAVEATAVGLCLCACPTPSARGSTR
jgi:hypothetical protein